MWTFDQEQLWNFGVIIWRMYFTWDTMWFLQTVWLCTAKCLAVRASWWVKYHSHGFSIEMEVWSKLKTLKMSVPLLFALTSTKNFSNGKLFLLILLTCLTEWPRSSRAYKISELNKEWCKFQITTLNWFELLERVRVQHLFRSVIL